jgi:hypothetical protein
MAKLTLPIEIGRCYVRRDGKVVTAREVVNHPSVVNVGVSNDPSSDTWAYAKDGRILRQIDYAQDLIADAPEEPTTYAIADYADALRAIADGRELEFQDFQGRWYTPGANLVLGWLANLDTDPKRFRIKPDTITINGREVPAPVREVSPRKDDYFLVDLLSSSYVRHCRWADTTKYQLLADGLIHLTEEAARQHAEALLSFTRKN